MTSELTHNTILMNWKAFLKIWQPFDLLLREFIHWTCYVSSDPGGMEPLSCQRPELALPSVYKHFLQLQLQGHMPPMPESPL